MDEDSALSLLRKKKFRTGLETSQHLLQAGVADPSFQTSLFEILGSHIEGYISKERFKRGKKLLHLIYEFLMPVLSETEASKFLNEIACKYRKAGKYSTARKVLFKILSVFEACPTTFSNLCAIMSDLDDHTQALVYGKKACQLAQEEFIQLSLDKVIKDYPEKVVSLAVCYYNIGVQLEFLHKSGAKEWFAKAYAFLVKHGPEHSELLGKFKKSIQKSRSIKTSISNINLPKSQRTHFNRISYRRSFRPNTVNRKAKQQVTHTDSFASIIFSETEKSNSKSSLPMYRSSDSQFNSMDKRNILDEIVISNDSWVPVHSITKIQALVRGFLVRRRQAKTRLKSVNIEESTVVVKRPEFGMEFINKRKIEISYVKCTLSVYLGNDRFVIKAKIRSTGTVKYLIKEGVLGMNREETLAFIEQNVIPLLVLKDNTLTVESNTLRKLVCLGTVVLNDEATCVDVYLMENSEKTKVLVEIGSHRKLFSLKKVLKCLDFQIKEEFLEEPHRILFAVYLKKTSIKLRNPGDIQHEYFCRKTICEGEYNIKVYKTEGGILMMPYGKDLPVLRNLFLSEKFLNKSGYDMKAENYPSIINLLEVSSGQLTLKPSGISMIQKKFREFLVLQNYPMVKKHLLCKRAKIIEEVPYLISIFRRESVFLVEAKSQADSSFYTKKVKKPAKYIKYQTEADLLDLISLVTISKGKMKIEKKSDYILKSVVTVNQNQLKVKCKRKKEVLAYRIHKKMKLNISIKEALKYSGFPDDSYIVPMSYYIAKHMLKIENNSVKFDKRSSPVDFNRCASKVQGLFKGCLVRRQIRISLILSKKNAINGKNISVFVYDEQKKVNVIAVGAGICLNLHMKMSETDRIKDHLIPSLYIESVNGVSHLRSLLK